MTDEAAEGVQSSTAAPDGAVEDGVISGGASAVPDARSLAERRRRLERIFGPGLPDQTRDDLDDPAERGDRIGAAEEWLRRQVPPHHGG